MSVVEVSRDYGGRVLTLQTGKLAKQADASVLATYGETMVLVTVVSSRKLAASQDFFPLTVDFLEKYYAAGRIPGGFFKREAKPSEKATLSARLIDRPIRPLFPEDYFYDTMVVASVLSADGVNDPDFVASIAASTALHISDIPFHGPVASCRVGLVDGNFVLNIPPQDTENSTMDLLVSGVKTGIVMVEGLSKEVSEQQMVDAFDFALESMKPIFEMQDELRTKVGKEKREYEKPPRDEKLKKEMRQFAWGDFGKAFSIREKLQRYKALDEVKEKLAKKFSVEDPKTDEEVEKGKLVKTYYEDLKAAYARENTLSTNKRIDGRPYNEIRPIACETGILPRAHGSGLFTRGETQVLSTVTLGTADDEQTIDGLSGVYEKAFLLHYNFPPFSVGEARPMRPPGRREVGHGFLAERALSFIIPGKDKFPYTIRIVSEVLESNGSSSMATVCSGTLALMDAGVPVPKAVAGVAMGLIKEGEQIAVLSDILGDEDHLGDMDFKVCGTQDGITAFQMDLKIGGVSRDIMEKALAQAKEGRLHILSKMNEALSAPRANLAKYAPRIFTIKVRPDKVREVIGSGGKVVRGIIEKTGVKIDIEDDGTIHVASADEVSAQKAIEIINQIVEEAEPGKIYEGKVTRIADFGAFVEIIPGTDGLCHISELDTRRVGRVEDVVRVGDTIRVKCLEVDPSGKIRLSRRALLGREEGESSDEGGGGGRGRRGGGRSEAPRNDRRPEGSEQETAGEAPADAETPENSEEMAPAMDGDLDAEEAGGSENEEEGLPQISSGFAPQPSFGGGEDDNIGNRTDRGPRRDYPRSSRGGGEHRGGGRSQGGGGYRDRDSGGGGGRRGGGGPSYDRGGVRTDRGGRGPERSSSSSGHSDRNRGMRSDRNGGGYGRGPDRDRGGDNRSPRGGSGGGPRGRNGDRDRGGYGGGEPRGDQRNARGGGGDRGGYGNRDRGGYDRGGRSGYDREPAPRTGGRDSEPGYALPFDDDERGRRRRDED